MTANDLTPPAEEHDDIVYPSAIPFVLVHLACFAAIWTGVTWQAAVLGIALYWLRIFGIGAGYHRYFSHRAYSTGRAFQFVLAFLSQSTTQKSVLWWAAKHRHHHLHSDTENDVHSPRQKGFLYSHVGWVFSRHHDSFDAVKVEDLMAYPELRWLHRHEKLPAIALAVICWLIAGWPGLVVGFFWSTVAVYHATFYILKLLSFTGLVWDLKKPSLAILRNEQKLGARVIERAAKELAASFNYETIAGAMASALGHPSLAALQQRLADAQHQAAEILASAHLPHLPTRAEISARAAAMFARTRSIDDIVERAYAMVLDGIGARLRAIPGHA